MNRTGKYAFAALACMLVAGCGGKKEPTGQVVATIDGAEVTALDLQAEMGAYKAPDAATRKRAEQQALEAILSRKAVAEAARKAGIEKTPQFAQQQTRMTELLLIQAYQSQLASQVPEPSRIEIDKYIADYPDSYANRKILTVDQIRMGRTNDPTLTTAMRPLKTMEEIEALLNQRKIAFQRGADKIDALQVPPPLFQQIVRLPPGEVFVIPAGNVLTINRITQTEVVPVTGQPAVAQATRVIKAQRTQEAVQRQLKSVVDASKAEVLYNKAYQPAAPAAKPAAPAAAPAAKAPAK